MRVIKADITPAAVNIEIERAYKDEY